MRTVAFISAHPSAQILHESPDLDCRKPAPLPAWTDFFIVANVLRDTGAERQASRLKR